MKEEGGHTAKKNNISESNHLIAEPFLIRVQIHD